MRDWPLHEYQLLRALLPINFEVRRSEYDLHISMRIDLLLRQHFEHSAVLLLLFMLAFHQHERECPSVRLVVLLSVRLPERQPVPEFVQLWILAGEQPFLCFFLRVAKCVLHQQHIFQQCEDVRHDLPFRNLLEQV